MLYIQYPITEFTHCYPTFSFLSSDAEGDITEFCQVKEDDEEGNRKKRLNVRQGNYGDGIIIVALL